MTELRVYLLVKDLGRQFAAYMSTPTRARGYPPMEGEHSLIIEVAPALAIHRICDLALKKMPDMEPGLLYTERQYGILELHSADLAHLNEAGKAILDGIGHKAEDQLKPRTLYADIIEDVSDQHAIILNRTREASMLLPGKSLLVYELEPALFASVAANEAEKVAPGITLVDVQMIGASGRLFLAGTRNECERARDRIDEVLGSVIGRSIKN
ncbi:microcompartment protein [Dongia sp.]|uniref:microcompartment protein n=1 Tax=Dongia sp. TaxID=1977262 RepID=UPI0035B4F391